MKKKLILTLAAVAAIAVGVVGMAAFEAHVINVTARIENALSVTPDEIMFGSVFPQEKLYRNLNIALSNSFLEEDRVDDVKYVIKQKPKCVDGQGVYAAVDPATHECPGGTTALPSLCEYLSKTPDAAPENDSGVPAFHDPSQSYALGYLAKSAQDLEDEWVIDLHVPCFEGMCDQAALDPLNEEEYIPEAYRLDPLLNSKVFGCDLWVEITEISANYTDRVDFGDPESEAGHLAVVEGDWSYPGDPNHDGDEWLKKGNYGGYDGGSANFRGLMGSSTGCGEGHWHALFMMDAGVGGGKKLVLRHLDGSQNDSFDIYADGQLIGHYSWQDAVENWVTTEWTIPDGIENIVEFKLVATDPVIPWCESGWGQVMLNWAEVR